MRNYGSRSARSGQLHRLASRLSAASREQFREYLQLQLQIQALEARCAALRRALLATGCVSCRRRRRAGRLAKGGRHECR